MPLLEEHIFEIAQIISDALQKVISLVKMEENLISDYQRIIGSEYLSRYLYVKESQSEQGLTHLFFDQEYEDGLYPYWFYSEPSKNVYHYTDLFAVEKILNSMCLRMSSISGLNDKSELTYADELLLDKRVASPFHHKRMDSANQRFVFSCTIKQDNLNQWRWYGADGAGVCLKFRVLENRLHFKHYFAIGRIVYGKTLLATLSRLIEDIRNNFGFKLSFRRFFLWKNFIKPIDYKDEEEFRLLFFNNKAKGKTKGRTWGINKYGILTSYVSFNINKIELPLRLTEITLGPKSKELELNVSQTKSFLRDLGLNKKIKVKQSKITHYR